MQSITKCFHCIIISSREKRGHKVRFRERMRLSGMERGRGFQLAGATQVAYCGIKGRERQEG